jgi:exosortase
MSADSLTTSPGIPQGSIVDRLKSGPVLLWSIAVLVQVPLLTLYLVWMWRFEHYQYIPFLLIAVACLAWSRLTVTVRYPDTKIAGALLILSQVVLLVGSALNSPWFASVSFFLLAWSFLVTHRMASLAVPLLLLIRLPLNYDVRIITELQSLTTRLASYILDLLYVPHLARGNVLELADRELFVAEACSGVQSAFTVAFIALLIAAWRRRPLALVPVYLAIALVWAMLCNTIRVTTIAYAAARLQWDLSEGIAHDILGYGTLLLAALLTLSTDFLLALLFHSVGDEPDGEPNPLVTLWQVLFANSDVSADSTIQSNTDAIHMQSEARAAPSPIRKCIYAALAIGALSVFPVISYSMVAADVTNPDGKPFFEPPRDLLMRTDNAAVYVFQSSSRDNINPQLGRNADTWEFRLNDLTGSLVFSQPYAEWHDLNVCYRSQGWALTSGVTLQPNTKDNVRARIPYSMHVRRDGLLGHLFMAAIRSDGTIVDAPASTLIERLIEKCVAPELHFRALDSTRTRARPLS